MNQNFDTWNSIKKEIESIDFILENFPKKREVWIVTLGKNIGFEQNGTGDGFSRPMLVIKKFNNQMFWCIPLSTHQKSLDFYFNFTDPQNQKVSLILAQMRLMSIKRFQRMLYEMEWSHFDIVKTKLHKLLE